jgi:hypothetical protein
MFSNIDKAGCAACQSPLGDREQPKTTAQKLDFRILPGLAVLRRRAVRNIVALLLASRIARCFFLLLGLLFLALRAQTS